MEEIKSWDSVAGSYLEQMEEPEKVAVVSDAASSGSGVARVARELALNFREKNIQTVFYCPEGNIDVEFRQKLEEAGIVVECIAIETGIEKIRKIRKISAKLEKENLDYINAHGFYLPLAAVHSSVPVLKTYHAHITRLSEVRKNPVSWFKWLAAEAPSIWFAEKRVSISEYARRQMKRFYFTDSKVIYNGIDKQRFRQKQTDFRRRHGIPEDAYVVGSLSALKKYKNQRKTLEIFEEEYDTENDYLLIGGDGPRKEFLEQKARELGIEERTTFLGYVPEEDLVDFYNAIDLFIYPSKWEGFGLPPVEAKLCGCELKMRDIPSKAEILEGG